MPDSSFASITARTGFFFGSGKFFPSVFVFVLSFLFFSFSSSAYEYKSGSSWNTHASIHDAAPPLVVAVDKGEQNLYLIERNNPSKIALQYVCTTGQAVGDKLVQGDLKTPEGVYFVVRKRDSGLDYVMYGNEAYTLNYPNPVDKLRRKTGYGIWIHGRGVRIVPLMTQGCVALNNEDIAVLGKMLTPGTPVMLAQSFEPSKTPSAADKQVTATLTKKVESWAKAWESRSSELFSFYDADAYTLAQSEAFSAFKAQKERLFKTLPWIKISVSDIQVLPGPGYWVTWFYQDYAAPNLTTQGVRRLYWEKTADNDFKIVGMEWIPGMTTSLTMASLDNSLLTAEGRQEGGGQDISEEQAVPLPGAVVAAKSGEGAPAGSIVSGGNLHAMLPQLDHVEDPRFGKMAEPPNIDQSAGTPAKSGTAPSTAKNGGTAEPSALGLPPALPSQGLGGTSVAPVQVASAEPAQNNAQPSGSTPAAPANSRPAEAQVETGKPVSPTPVEEPVELPVAVTSNAKPSNEFLTSQAESLVENWRSAWESGNVDSYMDFYAPKAVQGSRKSAGAIRDHKKNLWSRNAPKKVALKNISVKVTGDKAVVTMIQEYSDAKGGGDKGKKTLELERAGNTWRISNETWSAIP